MNKIAKSAKDHSSKTFWLLILALVSAPYLSVLCLWGASALQLLLVDTMEPWVAAVLGYPLLLLAAAGVICSFLTFLAAPVLITARLFHWSFEPRVKAIAEPIPVPLLPGRGEAV